MMQDFAKTPHYVLHEGSQATSPIISNVSLDTKTSVIFGFSDKPEYDLFVKASSRLLTPYPLVKGYLKNRIALDADSLRLVVLDAVHPTQETLQAATFQEVLEAIELDSESVALSYRLTLDATSQSYRVEPLVTPKASSSV